MKVRSVMSAAPFAVDPLAPVVEVARVMRDEDIGMVLVADPDQVYGLVTDRDLVVRGLATGEDVRHVEINTVCSAQLVVVDADDETDTARLLMREHAVRRLPVVEENSVVGVVSLADIAEQAYPKSTEAKISSSPPNR